MQRHLIVFNFTYEDNGTLLSLLYESLTHNSAAIDSITNISSFKSLSISHFGKYCPRRISPASKQLNSSIYHMPSSRSKHRNHKKLHINGFWRGTHTWRVPIYIYVYIPCVFPGTFAFLKILLMDYLYSQYDIYMHILKRNFHGDDKAILPPFYLHDGISYDGIITSSFWNGSFEPPLCAPLLGYIGFMTVLSL